MLLKDVADRAAAYGMPSEIVDGMDAVAVYQAAGRARGAGSAGEGPSFLEAKTYRYYDHQGVKGLRIPYRTQEEIDTWLERDAITALEQRARRPLTWFRRTSWRRSGRTLARRSRPRSATPRTARIPIPPTYSTTSTRSEDVMREITYVKAFTESLMQVMAEDEDVVVIGEDVAHYGGVFHAFDGLWKTFGERRVIDTPDLRDGVHRPGRRRRRPRAAAGLRPDVHGLHRRLPRPAVNQAAKLKYMFGGDVSVPLTITTAGGAGLSAGPQHSQSLEAWLAHVPGLKVALPSSPHDVKGLMVAAVRDDNPTVVDAEQAHARHERTRPRGDLRDPARPGQRGALRHRRDDHRRRPHGARGDGRGRRSSRRPASRSR